MIKFVNVVVGGILLVGFIILVWDLLTGILKDILKK